MRTSILAILACFLCTAVSFAQPSHSATCVGNDGARYLWSSAQCADARAEWAKQNQPQDIGPVGKDGMAQVQSGDLISVRLLSDVGSRISNEGDTFGVVTIEDYYAKGRLVLPKGSPGYGVITHLKHAGSWHSGGELSFTVKRLVAPDGTTVNTETNGATADADKAAEKNGNEVGQYLLFGWFGVFSHRGNDILVRSGTLFHVAASDSRAVPAVRYGTQPAALNDTLLTIKPGGS